VGYHDGESNHPLKGNHQTGYRQAFQQLHVLVRYEDLVRHPRPVVEKVMAELHGRRPEGIEWGEGGSVQLGVNHTVSGNPVVRVRLGCLCQPRREPLCSSKRGSRCAWMTLGTGNSRPLAASW